jgi:serpin B
MFMRTILSAAVGMALAGSAIAKTVAMPNDAPPPQDPAFAIDLYKQLAATEGNVFFSPFSIDTALAMTSAGARGDTLAEMNKVLGLPDKGAHESRAALIRAIMTPPQDGELRDRFQLEVASALWGQNQFAFDDSFLKTARTSYQAEAQSLDFGDSESARKTINDWVAKKTNDRIKDLIGPGAITTDTRLVLTNAVYFKGAWASQFSKDATSDQPFNVSADKTEKVPTMRQTERFSYAEDGTWQAVAMSYTGGPAQMIVLLPKTKDGLAKAEAALDAKSLTKLLGEMKGRKVDLWLPKFSFEFAATLRKPLEALGMKLAFDGDKADFSGMSTAQKLAITDVLHKAFVKVDEEGTEAAAATAVVMGVMSAAPQPEEVLELKVDHPFLVLIRHNQTGAILFMGRVANPK